MNTKLYCNLDPQDGRPKSVAQIEELQYLFINMSHLLNMQRPRVARQHLIKLMQEQVDRRVSLVESVERFNLPLTTLCCPLKIVRSVFATSQGINYNGKRASALSRVHEM